MSHFQVRQESGWCLVLKQTAVKQDVDDTIYYKQYYRDLLLN